MKMHCCQVAEDSRHPEEAKPPFYSLVNNPLPSQNAIEIEHKKTGMTTDVILRL
jgi:hypothetical protein